MVEIVHGVLNMEGPQEEIQDGAASHRDMGFRRVFGAKLIFYVANSFALISPFSCIKY
jgi:hypothetical protein